MLYQVAVIIGHRTVLRACSFCVIACLLAAFDAGCSGGQSSTASTPSTDIVGLSVPAPATPTPGVSDGFSQDALGGAASGWNVVGGSWAVCISGSSHAYCQTSMAHATALTGSSSWGDYTVETQVSNSNVTAGVTGLIGHAISPSQYYSLVLRAQIGGSKPYWYVNKVNGATITQLAAGPINAPLHTSTYGLRLSFSKGQIAAAVASGGGTSFSVLCSGIQDGTFPSGQVGLLTSGQATAQFTSLNVTNVAYWLTTTTAVSSDSIVDSMGMNANLVTPKALANKTSLNALIGNLGVRYYRVSADNVISSSSVVGELTALNKSAGITYDILSDILASPANVATAVALLPAGSIASIEGPNEADNPGQGIHYDPKFATDLPQYMRSLYTTVKSNPKTALLPVIGPSLINSSSYAALGNISSFVDFGNMHNYFAGFSPGTRGWGGTFAFAPQLFYGSIPWNVAAASQATSPKPVVATETGYSTAVNVHGCVPMDVQAKYVPRLFLESYRDGVARTYLFQLMAYDTVSAVGSLGIVSPSGIPNPAYTALAGMISLLSEHGQKSANVTYNLGMTGNIANVHSLLLHKVDGSVLMPLWIEQPSFDINANNGLGAYLTVPTQSVTISFPGASSNTKLATYDPSTGAWTTHAVTVQNGLINLNVTDAVSILEISTT